MSIPVKIWSSHRDDGSAVPGMPSISGTAGSRIAALKAFLIDGANTITPDSITISGGVGTVAKAGHGFRTDDVVLVSWNGYSQEKYVDSHASGTFTFDASDASGPPSGALSVKFAPVGGWEQTFTATNKCVFRNPSLAGTGRYFRFDDTAATYARIRMYQSMTDVDTGTAPVPLATQMANGVGMLGSTAASGTARPWVMIADPYFCYVFIDSDSTLATSGMCPFWFGDPVVYAPADVMAAQLGGNYLDSPTAKNQTYGVSVEQVASRNGRFSCAAYDQATGSVHSQWDGGAKSQTVPSITGGFPYDALFSPLELGVVQIYDDGAAATSGGNKGVKRGRMPGLYLSPQIITAAQIPHLSKRSNLAGLTGVTLTTVLCVSWIAAFSHVFIATRGPSGWSGWR